MCEERLQFSLSENVKTNVLWGSTVKDTVTLRPWGEQIKESSADLATVDEEKQEGRYGNGGRGEKHQRKETSEILSAPHNDAIPTIMSASHWQSLLSSVLLSVF